MGVEGNGDGDDDGDDGECDSWVSKDREVNGVDDDLNVCAFQLESIYPCPSVPSFILLSPTSPSSITGS